MCDEPKVINYTDRKARKEYNCTECPIKIVKGETYVEVKGLWDSSWDTYRFHQQCYEFADAVASELNRTHGPWECMAFGDAWETAEELEFACLLSNRWRWAEDEDVA